MNFGSIRRIRSFAILCLDILAAICIFSGVYYLRLKELPNYQSVNLWLIISTFIITLFLSGTYFKKRSSDLPPLPIRTFFVCLSGGTLCILWVYLLGPNAFNQYFGRGILPFGTILLGFFTTGSRFVINRLYHLQEKEVSLLYLGYSQSAATFLQALSGHAEVRSVTIISDQKNKMPNVNDHKHIKTFPSQDTDSLLKRKWHAIIIDPEQQPNPTTTNKLITTRLAGTPILSLTDYYEKNWFMLPVQHIKDQWFLQAQGFSMHSSAVSQRIKRMLDIFLAFTILIISSPVVLFCCLLIKLTSKGPVFFNQARVGMQGEIFTIHKLRTMELNAELNGAQWAQNNDPRVTLIGNFLRKSRLDELPQCWNVLKAEMSFIGPRPERPEFTKKLSKVIPYYDLRHMVKPGITGWAQVMFPYGASEGDSLKKLQYELYYIKNQSLLLDLNIILRTLITVFQRAGR